MHVDVVDSQTKYISMQVVLLTWQSDGLLVSMITVLIDSGSSYKSWFLSVIARLA